MIKSYVYKQFVKVINLLSKTLYHMHRVYSPTSTMKILTAQHYDSCHEVTNETEHAFESYNLV